MFDKTYEERLSLWSQFRDTLETSKAPFQDVIDFYNQTPLVSLNTDPWNPETWPTPWELLKENQYCAFCRVLGYCFSLQLTERFKDQNFEIHINTDSEKGYYYFLVINREWVLGYDDEGPLKYENIAKDIKSQLVYPMHTN